MSKEKQKCPQCGNIRVIQEYGVCAMCKQNLNKQIKFLLSQGWLLVQIKPIHAKQLETAAKKSKSSIVLYVQEIIEVYLAEQATRQRELAEKINKMMFVQQDSTDALELGGGV